MTATPFGKLFGIAVVVSLSSALVACASGASPGIGPSPSGSGTHTVMGRAFFPGGIMVFLEAHVQDGSVWGTLEYSQVQGGGGVTLRVSSNVGCIGVFREGTQAVVAGPVTRVDGDYQGIVGVRDWWMVQIEEGGTEGDRLLSSRIQRDRALSLCHQGPDQAATLKAVDGDVSIH